MLSNRLQLMWRLIDEDRVILFFAKKLGTAFEYSRWQDWLLPCLQLTADGYFRSDTSTNGLHGEPTNSKGVTSCLKAAQ